MEFDETIFLQDIEQIVEDFDKDVDLCENENVERRSKNV